MKIDYLSKRDLALIKPLIMNYKFNELRNQHVLNKEIAGSYLLQQVADLIAGQSDVFIVMKRNVIVGLCVLTELSLESKIFGFKMARIEYLIADCGYVGEKEIKDFMVLSIIKFCRNKKILHLSCRMDAGDLSSIHALETAGFRMMDTLLTYGFRSRKYTLPRLKNFWSVRKFSRSDRQRLTDIAGTVFLGSRFYNDVYTQANAGKFYSAWIRKCCDGDWADNIIVAERNGEIVGFISYKTDKKLYKFSGLKIVGRGLLAAPFNIPGVPFVLMKALIIEIRDGLGADEVELDTQVNNLSVIKMCQKFGLQMFRARHTFHKWLGVISS